jgi:hypothetical protein
MRQAPPSATMRRRLSPEGTSVRPKWRLLRGQLARVPERTESALARVLHRTESAQVTDEGSQ